MYSTTSTAAPAKSRPRPKPKPKQPAAGTSSKAADPSASSSSSVHQVTYESVKDDDEMFMRNRGRDKDAWAKLDKMNKGISTD